MGVPEVLPRQPRPALSLPVLPCRALPEPACSPAPSLLLPLLPAWPACPRPLLCSRLSRLVFYCSACCSACCFGLLFALPVCSCSVTPLRLRFALLVSLLACLFSLTFAVTRHGHRAVNENKQASRERDKQSKERTRKGNQARTTGKANRGPKQQAEQQALQ